MLLEYRKRIHAYGLIRLRSDCRCATNRRRAAAAANFVAFVPLVPIARMTGRGKLMSRWDLDAGFCDQNFARPEWFWRLLSGRGCP